MSEISQVAYERPVKARLVVRLATGEEWPATPADLAKFGFASASDMYWRAQSMLKEALGIEGRRAWDDHKIANTIRHIIECALTSEWTPWSNAEGEPWPEEDMAAWAAARDALRAAVLSGDET